MKRKLFAYALLAGLFLAAAQTASAQDPYATIYNRPTVSPYLNLLQNNQFGVTNYQTLVRPLVEQRDLNLRQSANINQLQQQVRGVQSAITRGPGQRGTGHETRFMNYSHFYSGIRR